MEKVINRLLVITALLALAFGAAAFAFRNSEHDTIKSEERELAFCEYIDIDLLRLDVTVIPYDGDKIRISYKSDLPLDISLGDNRLSISESSEFVISLFFGETSDFGLYLYLPKLYYREITIYTGSGDVKVGGLDMEMLTVITNSGNILCENSRCLSSLVTGTGDITLDCDKVADGTQIQSRKGNAQLIIPHKSSVAVDFETETGDCETKLISGKLYGSNMYSFNGGNRLVHASLEEGTLTISEKGA